MKSFSERALEETRRVRAFKKELKQLIAQLPDNPVGVKLLDRNVAVVPFSMLSHKVARTSKVTSIWSPGFFINRDLKNQLISIINRSQDFEKLDKQMRNIIETHQIRVWSPVNNTFINTSITDNVPEEFCQELKRIWMEEPTDDNN